MYCILFYIFAFITFCININAEVLNLQSTKTQKNSQLRVVCTAALLNKDYKSRKKEYIQCMKSLSKFGIRNPYIIEAIKGTRP